MLQVSADFLPVWNREGLPLCQTREQGVHCVAGQLFHFREEKEPDGYTANFRLRLSGWVQISSKLNSGFRSITMYLSVCRCPIPIVHHPLLGKRTIVGIESNLAEFKINIIVETIEGIGSNTVLK